MLFIVCSLAFIPCLVTNTRGEDVEGKLCSVIHLEFKLAFFFFKQVEETYYLMLLRL
jgi:hypothetical protein